MGRLWYVDANGKRKRTKAGIENEYNKFQSSSKAKSERASRNSARRSALRKGLVHKGDNMDVHHSNHKPSDNSPSNLRVLSAHKNRGIHEKSRKRGSKRGRK